MYARPESGELDPESPGYQFNTDFSVRYWLELGAKRETVRNPETGWGQFADFSIWGLGSHSIKLGRFVNLEVRSS